MRTRNSAPSGQSCDASARCPSAAAAAASRARSLWNLDQIAKGRVALDRALALGGRDPYVLQAAIAALHIDEPQDWPQLAALYGELGRLTGSPVVELNRAAAIAETGDVEAALALVERLELDHYHYLHATRAELLRRLDRLEDARAAYERALELVHSDAERLFLERRLAEVQDRTKHPGLSSGNRARGPV
jgi:RNA polymerase sigma-70 factor (ECF subfamily)